MNVLIACEFSGRVRDAFIAAGHNAVSCDLRATQAPGPHIIDDVRNVLHYGWDAMVAFPPCTYLANSGSQWFQYREIQQKLAVRFVLTLANAPMQFIAIENPVGFLNTAWRKPDQIIQPYNFGEDASKRTCLWLKNFPPLHPTMFISPRITPSGKRWANQTDAGHNVIGQSASRSDRRSLTYPGIADAMGKQWGSYLKRLE